MRARVAVASDALNTGHLALPTANLIHGTLLDLIDAHARLVFGGEGDIGDFLRALRTEGALPQDARTRWLNTLVRLRQQGRVSVLPETATPLASVAGLGELRQGWAEHADLAVISDAARAALGLPAEGVLSEPDTAPDVAVSATAGATPAMLRIRSLTDQPIAPHGSARESFWRDVLDPLATDARSAKLLDRFLFKAACDLSARKPSTRDWLGEHLVWLLRHLDKVMAPGAEVWLVGAWNSEYPTVDGDAAAQILQRLWKPPRDGRLRAVYAVLARPVGGEMFPHNRHVRFNTGGAIGLPAGFDRLRAASIWDPDGMEWNYVWRPEHLDALHQAEDRALALSCSTGEVLHR